jgi:RNA polymerase sigma-70 factor, ECF subfamily
MALSREDIGRIYREHGHRVYYRALRLLGSDAEAMDVVHEVFERLTRRRMLLMDPSHILPWLQKVASNLALNRIRDRRSREGRLEGLRQQELEELLDSPREAGPIQALTVERLLSRADGKTREAVLAYYFDGYTLAEIASTAGASVATVHRRIKRFLERSRGFLERDRAEAAP